MATIRDYTITGAGTGVYVEATDTSQDAYTSIPTLEEINETLGLSANFISGASMFRDCSSMLVSPMLPEATNSLSRAYEGCSSLVYAPVIPQNTLNLHQAFMNCTALFHPPSIPADVSYTTSMFEGCTNMSGYMIIRPTSLSGYTDMFKDTTGEIYLLGDKDLCDDLASTANNGNVQWAKFPHAPFVTDRGEGSRTTALDMQRIIWNTARVVDSFCPSRMWFYDYSIIHQDEWLEIVRAVQTIDATVTASTHYANLNKLESALKSAL